MSASVGAEEARRTLNLDGVWSFATDPEDRGEAEKWYQPATKLPAMPLLGYAPKANGTIRVPGIWDNQGYGKESEKLHHDFAGKGWYKRTIEIPRDWAGRRVFLVITGVSRYAKTWINDQYLGEHIGFLSNFEYDLTQYVTPGQTATLTIQVDSKQRWAVDTMFGSSTTADYVDVEWGGIWGHVRLEARSDVWLSDLFLQPDVPGSACKASATINGRIDATDAVKAEVFNQNGRRVAEATTKLESKLAASDPPASVTVKIPNPKLWSPDSPTLYTAKLSLLKGNEVLDTVESRFGMRQFTIDGYRILLNGKRIMLRGYGDDHIYAEQMAMPSDKELHLKQLRIIKSYGFNHVRHHSAIMPPEYYDACDEIGMIPNGEFPIAYAAALPGVGRWWQEKSPPGTKDPGPALETYRREWAAAIKQNRNHPSIFCWVMGNELYDETPKPRSLFADIARQYDPTRPFIDSDGLGGIPNEQVDRKTLDLWSVQFAEWSSLFDNPGKLQTPKPKKPLIEHEAGNYPTFSRPDLVDQFKHNFKPFWLTAGRTKLEKLGLLEEAGRWAEKSERLYAVLHKANLEALRRNPYMSGYHWWLFQDYWTSSNGLVDHYFRPKSITKEEVLQYNSEVVLLQDGLQRTYRGKNRLQLKLLVSNFSPETLEGTLNYEVKSGERSFVENQLIVKPVPQGELAEIGPIDLELPDVDSPVPVKITTTLVSGDKRFTNDWTTRLYPAAIRPVKHATPIFADDAKVKQFAKWGVKPIPSNGDLPPRAIYLAGQLDARILDAMDRGACVVLFDGSGQCRGTNLVNGPLECACVVTRAGAPILKPYAVTFRTSWWKAGEKREENNTGTFVYDHAATRVIAPDGWCDDGWFYLMDGGCKFDLEAAPARPDVLIRALTSMLLPADEALLFEVGIGKGCLIASGLNHRQAKDRPENEWLIARLIDHAAQFPQPKPRWPASFLTPVSVAPKGCVPGFHRLVSNKGEEGNWYSFREDSARMLICRQNKPGNRITWETAASPLPLAEGQGVRAAGNATAAEASSSNSVTFVFAGGLGFGSEPKSDGFVLEINGKEVVRFDLPEPKTWQSADKRVELRFDSSRAVSVDQFGLFYLTIPRDMLKPGKPCVLAVRSLGTDSRRWFGLNTYP
jgi:hypothetical protein